MRNKGQPGVSPSVGALHPEMPEGGQAVPRQEQGGGTGHERQRAQGGSVPALGSGCAEETGGPAKKT